MDVRARFEGEVREREKEGRRDDATALRARQRRREQELAERRRRRELDEEAQRRRKVEREAAEREYAKTRATWARSTALGAALQVLLLMCFDSCVLSNGGIPVQGVCPSVDTQNLSKYGNKLR
jgi:hypothetical protein